jgi:hypothetical protein
MKKKERYVYGTETETETGIYTPISPFMVFCPMY